MSQIAVFHSAMLKRSHQSVNIWTWTEYTGAYFQWFFHLSHGLIPHLSKICDPPPPTEENTETRLRSLFAGESFLHIKEWVNKALSFLPSLMLSFKSDILFFHFRFFGALHGNGRGWKKDNCTQRKCEIYNESKSLRKHRKTDGQCYYSCVSVLLDVFIS